MVSTPKEVLVLVLVLQVQTVVMDSETVARQCTERKGNEGCLGRSDG